MADYNLVGLGFPSGLRIQNLNVNEYADLMSSNQDLGAIANEQVGGAETYLDTLKYFAEMNAYVDSSFTGQVIWAGSQQPSSEEIANELIISEEAKLS